MLAQCASSFLMIRPDFFRANEQTSSTNAFQHEISGDAETIRRSAIEEFNHVVNRLTQSDINVCCINSANPETPDAVFPNNWISFFHDGKVVLYPMMAENRKAERDNSIIDKINEQFEVKEVIDLSHFEKEGKYLEGTGSIVFDHQHKIAYAALSSRTNAEVLKYLCDVIGYKSFVFSAIDDKLPIYHTNVLLHIGNGYAIACLDAIPDIKERNDLRRMLAFTGHDVVAITLQQMRSFAGNMLQVMNRKGKYFTLLSSLAIRTLHLPQINVIGEKSELLSFDVHTIENVGGGSIRCMMAEIFNPFKVLS